MKGTNLQLGLFPSSGLEEKVSGKPSATVNDIKGYGFLENNLGSFRTKANGDYEAAQYLYFGFMDIGRGIPHEVYQAMDTAEIAAMFIGNWQLKKFGSSSCSNHKKFSYSELKNKPVDEIVSALVQIGFNYTSVIKMKDKGYNKHPTKRGDLKRRIVTLPSPTQQLFLQAFNRKRAIPNSENSAEFDFYDPNKGDGLDYTAAKNYTGRVIELIKSLYITNSQLQHK